MILLANSDVPSFLLPLHKRMVKFRNSLDQLELNNYWIVMEHFENQNMKKNIKSWVEQGLSVKAQALLLTLIVLPKQNGTVWETQAEMASFMGVTPLTVSRGMKELIKANLVEVAERGSYRVKENVGFKGA